MPERPTIKFGYDGPWVIPVRRVTVDRTRPAPDPYRGTPFEKFVPIPADCKPWVDAQETHWEAFFSMDVRFRVVDRERGLVEIPPEMKGHVGSFAPFHVGIYTGIRIKTTPYWATRISSPVMGHQMWTVEDALIETDWYQWFKNFSVIRINSSTPDEVFIPRGQPLCWISVVPKPGIVQEGSFDDADWMEFREKEQRYRMKELGYWDKSKSRPSSNPSQVFYPTYKVESNLQEPPEQEDYNDTLIQENFDRESEPEDFGQEGED
jgi:hypothetical protein